jgi:prepilin-type N-terminal cleavage/methylation domain-containing protein
MIRSRRHRSDHGFTLIEVLISTALLALMAGAIAAATSAGARTVGSGGAGDRLAGDHDLMTVEQMLGKDMARAECVYSPPSTLVLGYCTLSQPAQSICASPPISGATVLLCTAWTEFWQTPSPTGSGGACHVAVYYRYSTVGGATQIFRSEVEKFVNATPTTTVVVTQQHLTTNNVLVSVSPGSSGDVQVTLTGNASGVVTPPTAVYDYRPLGTILQTGPGGSTQLC